MGLYPTVFVWGIYSVGNKAANLIGQGQKMAHGHQDFKTSREDLIAELHETYSRLIKSLSTDRLYFSSISKKAKTPCKAVILREALYYRMTDLSGAAIELYQKNKVVPAITIVRAAFETAAFCYYVYEKLAQTVKTHDCVEMDSFLMKAAHEQDSVIVRVKPSMF